MIQPHTRMTPRCIECAAKMRFACQEVENSGFIHDVFECTKCRSTQSFVTPAHANPQRQPMARVQRSLHPGRSEKIILVPSEQQLSLFVKRVRRAMQDAKSRHLFCTQTEDDARGYPDVLRVLEWIEDSVAADKR